MGWQLLEAKDGQGAGFSWLAGLVQESAGNPAEISIRLVLSRKLLEAGQETIATSHLRWLAARGSAESAYLLGVSAMREGVFAEALTWMEHALALNPDHVETRKQVEALRKLVTED